MARNAEQWLAILTRCGVRTATAERWAPVFADTIQDDTFSAGDDDIKAFLPQLLHESNRLEAMRENLNYRASRIQELGQASKPGSRWRSLVPRAMELANNPRGLAEAIYGGRMGNGPEGSGDGWAYIGRSPLQITGKANYEMVGNLMGQDLVSTPELLEQPHFALEAMIAWWESTIPDDILGNETTVRRRVNGGTFGLQHCIALAHLVNDALDEETA